tara:strand:- start:22 stop:654 length:633 start_codon:yes stop_codon:yes gene_type:complete
MKKYLISGFITYYSLVIICAVFVVIAGCANKPPIQVGTPDYKVKKVETTIEQIPKWYLEIPTDKENVYSTGTATAPDLQLAVDIATLNAKTTLADRINGRLDAMMKTFIAKVGQDDIDSEVLTEVEKVAKNVIAEVDVAGYVPTNVQVYPSGTQFRAFILLTYSEKEARKVIVNRLRKNRLAYSKLKATDAWKELEDEVEKSKQDEKAIL